MEVTKIVFLVNKSVERLSNQERQLLCDFFGADIDIRTLKNVSNKKLIDTYKELQPVGLIVFDKRDVVYPDFKYFSIENEGRGPVLKQLVSWVFNFVPVRSVKVS